MPDPPKMKPVLIIGAGISGLALGQALKQSGIPFVIYERDASVSSRSQGFRLRLNVLGMKALAELVPSEVYQRIIETAATNHPGLSTINAKTGKPLGPRIWTKETPGGIMPRGLPPAPPPKDVDIDSDLVRFATSTRLPVDRKTYRTALLEGMEEHIKFGKEFATLDTSNGVVVHFADGTRSEVGSLVVGADGAYSGVRRSLNTMDSIDTGNCLIHAQTPLTPELEATLSQELGRGLCFVAHPEMSDPLVGGVSMLFEVCRFNDKRAPSDYVFWNLIWTGRAAERFGVDKNNMLQMPRAELAELSKRFTSDFHPSVRNIVEQQDANATTAWPRMMSDPENLPEWPINPFVTVIGDGVHVVTPTGGLGGNMALHDAALLFKHLKEAYRSETESWPEDLTEKFEKEMRADAKVQVRLVQAALDMSYPLSMWKPIIE